MRRVIKPYIDNIVWADNETALKWKAMLDTPRCRMYSGRRMFRLINTPLIRKVLSNAKNGVTLKYQQK